MFALFPLAEKLTPRSFRNLSQSSSDSRADRRRKPEIRGNSTGTWFNQFAGWPSIFPWETRFCRLVNKFKFRTRCRRLITLVSFARFISLPSVCVFFSPLFARTGLRWNIDNVLLSFNLTENTKVFREQRTVYVLSLNRATRFKRSVFSCRLEKRSGFFFYRVGVNFLFAMNVEWTSWHGNETVTRSNGELLRPNERRERVARNLNRVFAM